MRAEVVRAVSALADPEYQRRVWLRREYPRDDFYDDLTINVHILFDDSEVLPEPAHRVGWVVLETELPALAVLGQRLDAVVSDLGEAADEEYLADPRWDGVVAAAARAHAAMRQDPGGDVA